MRICALQNLRKEIVAIWLILGQSYPALKEE